MEALVEGGLETFAKAEPNVAANLEERFEVVVEDVEVEDVLVRADEAKAMCGACIV